MSEAETALSSETSEAGAARTIREHSEVKATGNSSAELALPASVESQEQAEVVKDRSGSEEAPIAAMPSEDEPARVSPVVLESAVALVIPSAGADTRAGPQTAQSAGAARSAEAPDPERPGRLWLVVAGLAALALGRLFWLSWDRPRLEESVREAQRQVELEAAERSSEEQRRRAIEDQWARQEARLREQSSAIESLAARLGEREKKLREAALLASALAAKLEAERGAAASSALESALDAAPIQAMPRLAAGLLGLESSRARGRLAKLISGAARLRWSTPEAITGSRLLRSSDGALLAALCTDGCVRVLSLPEERLIERIQSADSSPLIDVALAAEGRYLASLSRFGQVTLWELPETDWRGVIPFKLLWSKDLGPVSAICFAATDCLMSAGAEGLLALDVESGGIIGRRALSAGRLTQLRPGWEEGGIIAYGPGAMFFGRAPELNLEPLPLNVEPYDFVAVPSKSGVLLAAGEGCPLIIPGQRYLAPIMSKDEGPQQGAAVALAPDGVGFAISGPLGIALWKNEQERGKTLSPGKSGVARALAFGAAVDGRSESIYAMSPRQPLRRYDLREGRVAASSEGHSGVIRWLEREPKSRLVAAACGLSVSVWSESDGELVVALPLPSEAACWQGPGRLLTMAATRIDGAPQPKPSLIVWQVQPLKLLARIEGRPARGEFVGGPAG